MDISAMGTGLRSRQIHVAPKRDRNRNLGSADLPASIASSVNHTNYIIEALQRPTEEDHEHSDLYQACIDLRAVLGLVIGKVDLTSPPELRLDQVIDNRRVEVIRSALLQYKSEIQDCETDLNWFHTAYNAYNDLDRAARSLSLPWPEHIFIRHTEQMRLLLQALEADEVDTPARRADAALLNFIRNRPTIVKPVAGPSVDAFPQRPALVSRLSIPLSPLRQRFFATLHNVSTCAWFLVAFCIVVFVGLLLSIWWSFWKEDLSGGFTLGAFLTGAGCGLVNKLHTRHRERGRCHCNHPQPETEVELGPLLTVPGQSGGSDDHED